MTNCKQAAPVLAHQSGCVPGGTKKRKSAVCAVLGVERQEGEEPSKLIERSYTIEHYELKV